MNAAVEWANGLAGHWARGMWPVLWQTAAVAAAVGLILLCARRMSPAWRFWLWMLVPLRLLVMPLVTITLPILAHAPAIQPPAAFARPSAVSRNDLTPAPAEWIAEAPVTAPVPALQKSVNASPWLWLMIAWGAGACISSLRLARGWLRMKAIAARARENSDVRVRDCAREAATRLGLRRMPRIMISAQGASPFVLGFLRTIVVLPAALPDRVSPEELRTVLAHEFAHVRRRDALTGCVLACSDILYFFNPVVHLVKRAIIFERERACDEQVLALGRANRAAYARALLAADDVNRPSAAGLSCAPVLLESGQHLERRLKSIASERRPRATLSPAARIAVAAIMFLALPGIALTARSTTAPAASASSPSREVLNGSVSDQGGEIRTYDVAVPEEWKGLLSIGKFSLVGAPFYGVPWNWGVWTCIRFRLPLKNLTRATLYEQLSYRTESKLEGFSNAEMGVCYTLGPGEERLIDAIVPIASTERPVQFLLRVWDPVKTPPSSQTRWKEVGLIIDPLPVAKPAWPGGKIQIVEGNAEHFGVEEARLEHDQAKGNLLVMVARNKADKALPLGVSIAVNDPRNVENNMRFPMDHGSFASQLTTIAAGSEATVSVPYEIKPTGGNPLLAFSVFEPRPEYATFSERDQRSRDVTLVAWGAVDLALAAKRGDCVMPAPCTVGVALDAPNLHEGAVEFALFDKDPVPGFKSRVLAERGSIENAITTGARVAPQTTARTRMRTLEITPHFAMKEEWDKGFVEVTGEDVWLLPSVDKGGVSLTCIGSGGQNWLVTKAVLIDGKTLCWSIPFKAVPGGVCELTLTEKNALDLRPIFNEIIPLPPPDSPSAGDMSLRQYDIADLQRQMGGKKLLELLIERTGRENWEGVRIGRSEPPILQRPSASDAQRLMYLPGPDSNWLMVHATDAMHKKIEGVLRELREAPNKPAEPESAAPAVPPR